MGVPTGIASTYSLVLKTDEDISREPNSTKELKDRYGDDCNYTYAACQVRQAVV